MKSKMKKLVSLVLAMAMVFTMSAVVFASDDCTITVSGATENITYEAYKLMDLSVDTAGTAYTYTVNSKYTDILANAMKAIDKEGTDAATYLSEYDDDDDEVQAFADAVYAALVSASTSADYSVTGSSEGTATFTVAQGYYLIVETAASGDNDSVSLVMLETAGNSKVEAKTKEDYPTLVKKIQDTNDSTSETSSWQDSADYDIGDQVPYQLTATMPDNLSSYTTYKMIFHDVMESGLTFTSNSVVVTVDGTTTVDSSCYEVLVKADGDTLSDSDCTFEIVISDVKSLTSDGTAISVTAESSIVITYTAKLNENAVIGNPGNWNTANLEYSNNPYKSGKGDTDNTGETPDDTVVALTYDFTINKVKEDGTTALAGATFKLYKYDKVNDEWDELTLTPNSESTSFSATGLDDGVYKIVEESAPEGYNKVGDIYFIVTATHTNPIETSTTTPLTELNFEEATWDDSAKTATATGSTDSSFSVTLTPASGSTLGATKVVNKAGSVLPSTGGIGTTIFYIVGAVLVLGAGVVLVTRRRTRA